MKKPSGWPLATDMPGYVHAWGPEFTPDLDLKEGESVKVWTDWDEEDGITAFLDCQASTEMSVAQLVKFRNGLTKLINEVRRDQK